MKRIYRKNLLRDLVSKESNKMIPFLKNINILHVIDRISIAWNRVTPDTIRKSWRKLIPLPVPAVCDETAGDQSQEIPAVLDEAILKNSSLFLKNSTSKPHKLILMTGSKMMTLATNISTIGALLIMCKSQLVMPKQLMTKMTFKLGMQKVP